MPLLDYGRAEAPQDTAKITPLLCYAAKAIHAGTPVADFTAAVRYSIIQYEVCV